MEIQWPLLIFSLLAGCGGGIFAFLAYGEIRNADADARFPLAIVGIALIVVGGCASVAHIGNPANIMAAAANLASLSGISVELIFLGACVIVGIIYLVALKRESAASITKPIAIVAGVLGIILAFVTGNGYVMESRANWNTVLLPLCYLISGLTMGGAVYFAFLFGRNKESDSPARKQATSIVVVLAAIETLMFVSYGAVTGFAADIASFWVCAVIVGGIGTAICAWSAAKNASALYASAACAVIGGIGIRAAMWLLGTGFMSAFTIIASRGVLGI